VVLGMALFVPFEQLLVIANAAVLAVFAVVDVALWRVKRTARGPVPGMTIPHWLPPCAASISLGLIALELFG
jgi:basic amino acid/polyamine antiporter, APA family